MEVRNSIVNTVDPGERMLELIEKLHGYLRQYQEILELENLEPILSQFVYKIGQYREKLELIESSQRSKAAVRAAWPSRFDKLRLIAVDSVSSSLIEEFGMTIDVDLELDMRATEIGRLSLLADIARLETACRIVNLKLQGKADEAAEVVKVELQKLDELKLWADKNFARSRQKVPVTSYQTATIQ